MQDTMEEADYEAPELAEVGDFAALTLGSIGPRQDSLAGTFGIGLR
ncbi:lasso RiPP family leader peptide-containing protein [Streptomyces sp. NPDC018019]